MALIADSLLDLILDDFDTLADRIIICSAEPTTYAEANATYDIGAATISIPAPVDNGGAGGGRKVVVPATSGNAVDSNGTATHYAIVDDGASTLMAVNALSASVALTTSDTWGSPSFELIVKDAVSA